jgi:hypothetical protein
MNRKIKNSVVIIVPEKRSYDINESYIKLKKSRLYTFSK